MTVARHRTASPAPRRLGRIAAATCAAAVVLAACGAGAAVQPGDVEISAARVPVPAAANGAAYLTLTNDGDGTARLVEASSPAAGAVELHQTSIEDGTASMAQVDGVDVPGGEAVVFEPGGLHLMLLDVDDGLAEGDTVELTLVFESGDEQTVTADIVAMGDAPMQMGSDHMTGAHASEPMEMSSER